MTSDHQHTPLETCDNCGLVMDLSDMPPLTTVQCPECQANITVLREFGPFRLVKLLGTGGMGTVYKAIDVALRRPLALKILRKSLSHDASLTALFEREAALTARINHPHVVRVYSTGKAHGMFYIAMELVDAGSLDGMMEEQGRLPEQEVLRIGIQVAEGLQAATRAGLVHRDIKPGNILFDQNREAKIVDFGLAQQADQASDTHSELWGTPFYISPEALGTEPEDLRSDLYALGATLWHAVSGAPPHVTSSTSIQELQLLKKQPVDLRKSFPSAHPLTAAALNRAVAPNREDRYQDYESFARDLRTSLAAVLGRSQPRKKAGSRRILSFAFISIAALGAGAAWWSTQNAPDQSAPKTLADQNSHADELRFLKTCALLDQPDQLDNAIKRLELVSKTPGLLPDLQLWSGVALGTAFGLKGDLKRQAASLDSALESQNDPDRLQFILRLRASAGGPPLAKDVPSSDPLPERESIRLQWSAIRALNEKQPKEALARIQRAIQTKAGIQPPVLAADLLRLSEVISAELKPLESFEAELDRPPATQEERAARIKKAENLLASKRLCAGSRIYAARLLEKAGAPLPPSPVADKPPQPPTPKPGEPFEPPAKKPQERPPTPPTPPTPPAPPVADKAASDALQASAFRKTLLFQFSEAKEEAAMPQAGSPLPESDKKRILRQIGAVETLHQWAIQQLGRGGTQPSPILRNGAPFKSDPLRADERGILVQIAPSTPPVSIAWREISPLYLVKLLQYHLPSLTNSKQRADLLWGAGAVYLMSGSRQNAKPFLEEAATLNGAYSELLQDLLAGEGKP